MKQILTLAAFFVWSISVMAQTDVDSLMNKLEVDNTTKKEYVNNAFKSNRVINGHSMEMIPAGVLDFRILHRFGPVKEGLYDLFGLDEATMRMGFDYGITKDFTVGIGRSTFMKEFDGYLKYRVKQQTRGENSFPVSIVAVAGATVFTTRWANPALKNYATSRLGYYGQVILGRKFSEVFTFQLSPTVVHRNLVELATDKNDLMSLGIGARYKFNKKMAIVLDAFPAISGARKDYNRMPLSIGIDIETGGHVFQLHFSNATGMNEKAFITETTQQWSKSEFQFGFNLSRVFTLKQNKDASF
jgi:hypothetical protein